MGVKLARRCNNFIIVELSVTLGSEYLTFEMFVIATSKLSNLLAALDALRLRRERFKSTEGSSAVITSAVTCAFDLVPMSF